jgi:beta-xylosidase
MDVDRPTIANPILPGFNPDPSIIRVGEDCYNTASTFEWFPGVQIHHSRDLVNWELITLPLPDHRLCPLGRETAIEKGRWDDDGWLRLESGSTVPRLQVPAVLETSGSSKRGAID